MNEYLQLIQLFWPALLAATALALAGSIVGFFVMLRRESLLALALPQIVTLGVAAGLRLAWPTLPPAIAAVVVALLLLAWARKRENSHLFLPVLYVAGLCISILIVANYGADLIEVQNMFTGIDVAVEVEKSLITAGVLIPVAIACAVLWRRWLLLAQAPTTAELARLHPTRWNALFLGLLATVVVLATNAVGSAMVVVMLFIPAGTVLPWMRRIPAGMFSAVLVAIFILTVGFVLSNEMNWPLSHSIGGFGFALFMLSNVVARIVG
jgi:ABC-type Mn2+/Zn2+ transport system permease subunit